MIKTWLHVHSENCGYVHMSDSQLNTPPRQGRPHADSSRCDWHLSLATFIVIFSIMFVGSTEETRRHRSEAPPTYHRAVRVHTPDFDVWKLKTSKLGLVPPQLFWIRFMRTATHFETLASPGSTSPCPETRPCAQHTVASMLFGRPTSIALTQL